MPTDRLAPYRIAGIPPAAPFEPDEPPAPPLPPEAGMGMKDGKHVKVYAVDTSASRPQRFTCVIEAGIGHAFPYSAITEIAFDWETYSIIQIEFSAARLVKIKGANLKPICDALINGIATVIAEQKSDTGPSVTKIEVIRPGAPQKPKPEPPAGRARNAE